VNAVFSVAQNTNAGRSAAAGACYDFQPIIARLAHPSAFSTLFIPATALSILRRRRSPSDFKNSCGF
jgi:hypothetical protein